MISGGRNDTVVGNRVTHHGAWGILDVIYPDFGPPPPIAHCEGGIPERVRTGELPYNDFGNQVFNNVLSQNGFYGNQTNGDLAEGSLAEPTQNSNCWYANKHPDGSAPTTDPPNLQTLHGKAQCGQPQTAANSGALLAAGGLRHAGARLRSQHALPDSRAGRHPQAAAADDDAQSLRRRPREPVVPQQRQRATPPLTRPGP